MPRPEKTDNQLLPVIESMVRQGLSLRQAAAESGLDLTPKDCDDLERRKSFNKLLWQERHRYWSELSKNPERTKESTIGRLEELAQKLRDEGSYDKAANVLFQVAKIEGWTGNETQVNVFGSLSAKEFAELREKVKANAPQDAKPN